jgi:hypothetical protein
VAEEHEAVEGIDLLVGGFDEGVDGGGGDALGLGGGAGEKVRAAAIRVWVRVREMVIGSSWGALASGRGNVSD